MDGSGYEVAPGVHRIEAPLGDRYLACYLIVGDESTLLVDTGVAATVEGSILPYIASVGLEPQRIDWIVATHCDVDHMGGDAAARRAFPGATLIAHEADVELIEDVGRIVDERYGEFGERHGIEVDDATRAWCFDIAAAAPVDLVINGPTRIRLGTDRSVDVFATPGHSLGSISVWDRATRSALVGDAVLGSSVKTADGRPSFPPTYRHVVPYRATISDLLRRSPNLLLAAHEPAMGQPAALDFLAESQSFMTRLEVAVTSILQELRPGGATTRQLTETLSPKLGDWPAESGIFLAHALIGHLEAWVDVGRVSSVAGSDGLVEWRWQDKIEPT